MKKTLLFSLIAFVLIVVAVGALRLLSAEDNWLCENGQWIKHGNPNSGEPTGNCGDSQTACTLEAKLCPDGTSVGRVGPNCDFAPCPDLYVNTGLANPASLNCTEKGGTLIIKENKVGQYSICVFEDNRQCEEWALFRGECPVGGLKITGYETEAQAYCAITGGTVKGLGTDNVLCQRIDGTLCAVEANLNGECPDPHDPNPNADNVETY